MIFKRYIIRNIISTTLMTLLVLMSINLFFTFISQLDHIGVGSYDYVAALKFAVYKSPNQIVMALPMAVLIGSVLSLGTMANNNEIVASQAAGLSVKKLLMIVLQAGFIFACINLVLHQWIIAKAETTAYQQRNLAKKGDNYKDVKTGTWLKDGHNVIHVGRLHWNGYAQNITIYQLAEQKKLHSLMRAKTAVTDKGQWILNDVKQTELNENFVSTKALDNVKYKGDISLQLLRSLRIDPELMSLTDLYQYSNFLEKNGLENTAEKVMFWRKLYSPLSILVMSAFAVPFVLGSQRGGQAGQRLMYSIMLGMSYVVIDRILIGTGQFLNVLPQLTALTPVLIFMFLNMALLQKAVRRKS